MPLIRAGSQARGFISYVVANRSGGHLGWPAVRFALELAAPAVERVVKHEAMVQHLEVVLEARAQTQRDGEQPSRLRREIEALSIGAPHDAGELMERRLLQPVLGEERVEAAALA